MPPGTSGLCGGCVTALRPSMWRLLTRTRGVFECAQKNSREPVWRFLYQRLSLRAQRTVDTSGANWSNTPAASANLGLDLQKTRLKGPKVDSRTWCRRWAPSRKERSAEPGTTQGTPAEALQESCSEPTFRRRDQKDAGRCDRPASIKYVAASCPLLVCVSDRTSAQCRLRWASIGRCSQIWTPGVRVAIGLNSPLYSAGPRGFMSNVSCCEAPPVRNRKMTAFGRGVGPAGAVPRSRATSVIDNPRAPIVPAWRNARRPINGWRGLADVCIGLPPQQVVTDGTKSALEDHTGIAADRVEKTGMNSGRTTCRDNGCQSRTGNGRGLSPSFARRSP
jgi:hypothetical protein